MCGDGTGKKIVTACSDNKKKSALDVVISLYEQFLSVVPNQQVAKQANCTSLISLCHRSIMKRNMQQV